ncbi:LysR family transcriptional regulator [Aquincola sp. S2]|uniref:LysR family transcriptional regulator n=1 Tax=Pseudaquabacterium terrae TaxID=2732868 RepID=A0ABX2EK66_9BURK|nr:LysR family transcriptional regulator [Aquabacterium terrae]NRF68962.1 LysR family transcriptional regulator [Aquabacterium terrae]
MRMLDLDSLEIFRTVAREGGVIRAAARLNRVQSNVTTRIKQLEERLGVALFRRQGRSLVLSAEGDSLLVHAEQLLRLADEAESALRDGPARGPFRLGSLESTAGSRLPAILARYHRLHPAVVIELGTGNTAALLQKVIDYRLEAAFVSEPFTAPGLASIPVFEEELVLITARGHLPVQRAADLGRSTILAFSQGCSYRKRLEDWFGQANVLPERVLEFASYPAIIACVAAGTGCAIVPRSVLLTLRASVDVAEHALPERVRRNRTHLVWRGEPSPALQRLITLLDALPPASRAAVPGRRAKSPETMPA